MGLQTGEPEAAPSPHRDLRDTPDPVPAPVRAPRMTTTLVSATIFDLSEVLCKVEWGGGFASQSFLFSFLLKERTPKSSGLGRQGREEGRRDGSFFCPPPSLKEFGSPLSTLSFIRSSQRLHRNLETRDLGGEVGVAGLPGGCGALADWGSRGVVLSFLMGCLNRVSLICSGRAPGLAAAGRGFESLQPHCQACGVSRGALWGKLSLGRRFAGRFPPLMWKGWECARKRPRVVIQKDVAKRVCSGASVCPSAVRLLSVIAFGVLKTLG